MIGKYLEKINKTFGRILFNSPSLLYYYIFNKAHQTFIANKKMMSYNIKNYHKEGFFKTNIDSSNFCKFISSKINKQRIT